MIRIVNTTGYAGDTKVTVDDGRELNNIASIDISIRPLSGITATITMNIEHLDCVADPVFNEGDLVRLARKHGYRIVKVLP